MPCGCDISGSKHGVGLGPNESWEGQEFVRSEVTPKTVIISGPLSVLRRKRYYMSHIVLKEWRSDTIYSDGDAPGIVEAFSLNSMK